MDVLNGKGPSKRHEIFYFGGPHLGAVRIDDFKYQFFQQPYGWPGEKVTTDMPTIVNLRQDPFERTPAIRGETTNDMGGGYLNDFYAREFWRFVMVQQVRGQARDDGYRLSSDASAGVLQPVGDKGPDRRSDQAARRRIGEHARTGGQWTTRGHTSGSENAFRTVEDTFNGQIETQGVKAEKMAKQMFLAVALLGLLTLGGCSSSEPSPATQAAWRRPSYISISMRASRSSRVCISALPPTNRSATPTTMVRPNVSELDRKAASSSRADSSASET